jgi:hypothetical protein
LLVAAFAKEILQNHRAFILQNARCDVAMMIQRGQLQKVNDTSSGTGPRVCAAKNDTLNSHMHECARAHRARFLRHVKIAISQAPISYGSLRLRQREHFGMRGGVFQQFNLIIGARDNFSRPRNHDADRYLAGRVRFLRLSQCLTHESFIAWQINHHLRVVVSAALCRRVPAPRLSEEATIAHPHCIL